MKRQKPRNKPSAKPKTAQNPSPVADTNTAEDQPSRRDFMRKARNWGIGVAVLGGGGWYAVNDVRATMLEHDLTQIGNGKLSVVQIHDPQCPTCTALQREARAAMCELDTAEIQFLVANIRTDEGRKLASEHNVGHVTLLLLDKKGKRRQVLTGMQQSDYLQNVFRSHMARYNNS